MDAEQVKAIRAAAGMTQVQFAREIGVDPISVSRWERGVVEMHPVYRGLIQSKFGSGTIRAQSPSKSTKKRKNKAA